MIWLMVKLSIFYRSSRLQMFFKKGVLKSFATFTGIQLCWSLFLIKLHAFRPTTLLKETPTQVISCEISEIFNNYFCRTPFVAASVYI